MAPEGLESVVEVKEGRPHLLELSPCLHSLVKLAVLRECLQVGFEHSHAHLAAVRVQVVETVPYHAPVVVD